MNILQTVEPVQDKAPVMIIGAGGIVRDAHLPAYDKAGFTVEGIYDLQWEKAQALAGMFPSINHVYSSIEALIESNAGRDVVYDLAVPADQLAALLNRLPDRSAVLMQKPMGETLAEAETIFRICREKDLAAAVNFQLKYAPCMIAARDLIMQGVIGAVYDVELMVCVYTPWHLWDFLKNKPRLEILYHSIHYLDLIRSLLGMPQKVYASTVRHPHFKAYAATRSTMILDYEAHTQARVITNHGHDFGPDKMQSYLKIEGTAGAIYIQIGVSLDYPNGKPDTFEFVSKTHTDGRWTTVPLEGTWFPDAFIGPMTEVQRLRKRSSDRQTMLEKDLETMKLVEVAYRSSEEGGMRPDASG
jgi:predicted dehydrogenase